MKRLIKITYILLAGLGLFSCSGQQDKFILKGQFTNLNEAEIYFWTPDGGRQKLDTVMVHQGKFTYESPQSKPGWYTLLFQNMSEQVIFSEPGQSVELQADATHLRNMKIKGGKANALMTEFRKETLEDTQESAIAAKAQAFIQAHPESLVSLYLFQKYVMQRPDTQLQDAAPLVTLLLQHHADDAILQQCQSTIAAAQQSATGQPAQPFQVTDHKGRTLTLDSFRDSTLVLCFWANWSEQGKDDLRKLKAAQTDCRKDATILTVSLDMQRFSWRTFLRIDSIPGKHVCDMNAWESPVVRAYGICEIPTYILIEKNQVTARESTIDPIIAKLRP